MHAFSSSKTDDMIENDLIKSFKFLQLNAHDFKYFLRNKKGESHKRSVLGV